MEKYFQELDTLGWFGKTVILDIDGTIAADGSSEFDPLVLKKIKDMAPPKHQSLYELEWRFN